MEIETLKNLIVTPIIDEEFLDAPNIVGTLQLYNKADGDLRQEDLNRVSYISKLVGSTLIRCERIQITLQTLVGVKTEQVALSLCDDKVEDILTTTEN